MRFPPPACTPPPTNAIHPSMHACTTGLLICLALVDMMAEEFHRALVKKDRMLQAQMFVCIFSGAAVMSVLAIWA